MTYKNLYFGILGLLVGLLGGVYFSSKELRPESFGSEDFNEQFVVSTQAGVLKKDDYRLSYSPNVHRRLTLPMVLGAVVVIATVLGVIASKKESKKEAIQSITDQRASRVADC